MTSKERVRKALNGESPDRCPLQVSFTPEFAARLRDELGIASSQLHNPHGGGNTYVMERTIGEDLLLTSVGWANSYYQEAGDYTDEWGVGWRSVEYETRFGMGRYTEIASHPLADASTLETYEPPDPNRPQLYEDAEALLRTYGDDYWIVGVTVTTMFETAWALRGLDALLTDFVADPALANAILDIPDRYHLTAAKKLVELGVDMIWIGDDMGTQRGMLIAPALWRELFKPRLARFIGALKTINPDVKVAYHSDGDIRLIIPDLIEIGLDVLNPVQPACMDPAWVKKEFGDRLCFWGTIDEQHTLPFGSAEEVREQVLERIKTVGAGGGLIVAPTHHVQLDTPMENFWAMVNTVKETACV